MAHKLSGLLLSLLLFNSIAVHAQPADSTWYWWGGDYLYDQRGIYSFVSYWPYYPSPGARSYCAYWTDADGKFWMFGGLGYDASAHHGSLNDLWQYYGTNAWTWIKGSNASDQPDVYGTKGITGANNTPGGRYGSITWTDKEGNLWLFGGQRDTGPYGNERLYLNDLWKFSTTTKEWTWVKGENVPNQNGIYGTMGIADAANQPGARASGVSWRDASGNLWLFGGMGYGANDGVPFILSDLWKYDMGSGQWTWMKGSSSLLTMGVYGTQGVEASDNAPGARWGSAAWSDASGLWLWGGNGVSELPGGMLNDLWRYNPATNNWTWMKGGKRHDQPNTYGTKGIANDANTPCGRESAFYWKDKDGNFWLYGGAGFAPVYQSANGFFNDLWKFKPSTNQWTWMKGDTIPGLQGLYNVGAVPNFIGRPGSRMAGASWTGPNGGLWLFGGETWGSAVHRFNDLWVINGSFLVGLPVQLVQFSATPIDDDIQLQWKTGSEINFDHFNVQRSTDGGRFETIATVPGSTVHNNAYGYTDKNALRLYPGKIYYRLQMMDRDGRFCYSAIINLDGKGIHSEMKVYSNPARNEIQLVISCLQSERVGVEIISMPGTVCRRQQYDLQKGRNSITIDVSSLASGAYVVCAKSLDKTEHLKFIKQ